jgi:hypothetical protein
MDREEDIALANLTWQHFEGMKTHRGPRESWWRSRSTGKEVCIVDVPRGHRWSVHKVLWSSFFEDPSIRGIVTTFEGHVLETCDWQPCWDVPFEADEAIPRVQFTNLARIRGLATTAAQPDLELVEVEGQEGLFFHHFMNPESIAVQFERELASYKTLGDKSRHLLPLVGIVTNGSEDRGFLLSGAEEGGNTPSLPLGRRRSSYDWWSLEIHA